MKEDPSGGHLEFNLSFRRAKAPRTEDSESSFSILILGNFSGQTSAQGTEPLSRRRPVMVDLDNIDKVLTGMQVEIHLPADSQMAGEETLSIAGMDDFHPDRLFEKSRRFARWRLTRRQLQDPATFAAASAEVKSWLAESSPPEAPASRDLPENVCPPPVEESTKDLFSRLLGRPGNSPVSGKTGQAPSDLSSLIKQIVGPQNVAVPDPQQTQDLAAVDALLNVEMRKLLHEPAFQALEASWRALDFLVRRIESDESLRLFVLDLSREELADELGAAPGANASALFRLLVDPTPDAGGAPPWSLVLGDFFFEPGDNDARLLSNMAAVMQAAGVPFIAAADNRFLCSETPVEKDDLPGAWRVLRQSPQASSVGLALPRFLLRLPYGKETDPIESFDFQEIPGVPDPAHYLWGNPAFVCGCLLAQSFRQFGPAFSPGVMDVLDGLPLHVFKDKGESRMTPCAEAWLNDLLVEGYLNRGLMPLVSFRGRDAVRLARFQSIASPLKALAGRWG